MRAPAEQSYGVLSSLGEAVGCSDDWAGGRGLRLSGRCVGLASARVAARACDRAMRGPVVGTYATGCRLVVMGLLGALLASASFAQAWVGRGRLGGGVQDLDGNPVEGASVRLTLDGDGPEEQILTNRKGRWARAGLAGGSWEVFVTKPGYIPSQHTVRLNEYAAAAERPFVQTALEPGGQSEADGSAAAVDEGESGQAARKSLERGNELLRVGDFEGAIAVLDEALPSLGEGGRAAVLIAIAQAQVQLERDEEALASLESALTYAPANVDALQLISRRLTAMGRAEEAQEFLARLPENLRADPEILLREGVDLYNQNDFEGARSKFDVVIEAEPEWADAYYFRGLAHMAAGENAAAAADFRRLLELEPDGEKAEEARQFAEYLESL